jgi:hypothetical protein
MAMPRTPSRSGRRSAFTMVKGTPSCCACVEHIRSGFLKSSTHRHNHGSQASARRDRLTGHGPQPKSPAFCAWLFDPRRLRSNFTATADRLRNHDQLRRLPVASPALRRQLSPDSGPKWMNVRGHSQNATGHRKAASRAAGIGGQNQSVEPSLLVAI